MTVAHRERSKLIAEILEVAVDIEFRGRRDSGRLAKELDARGIRPLKDSSNPWASTRWYTEKQHPLQTDAAAKMRFFIKRNLPELWENGANRVIKIKPPSFSQCNGPQPAALKDPENPPTLKEWFLWLIVAAAREIQYTITRGDTWELLQVLNERELWKPDLRHTSFMVALRYSRRWKAATELKAFLEEHCPELGEITNTPVSHAPVSNPLLAKHDVAQLTAPPGNPSGQRKTNVWKESLNIVGWSIQCDKKGHYRAYRRINGKLKSAYLGRSLDGAAEKLKAAEQKFRAKAVIEPEY